MQRERGAGVRIEKDPTSWLEVFLTAPIRIQVYLNEPTIVETNEGAFLYENGYRWRRLF